MRAKLFALMVLVCAVATPAALTDQLSAQTAEAIYYQPDGVIKVVPESPLADVRYSGEILRSDGSVYWSSILVALGGESEVFLMESQSRILYDMPDGAYTVTLHPQSGSFEDVTASLTVHTEKSSGGIDLMVVALAVLLIAAIAVAAFLIYRRQKA